MSKRVEQSSAHALSTCDTENHCRSMAATGDVRQAPAMLNRLDALNGVSKSMVPNA